MTPREFFSKLVAGDTIRHKNGVCYLIVRVSSGGRVFARWRNGQAGRFGKEVVEITPAHVRGFQVYSAAR